MAFKTTPINPAVRFYGLHFAEGLAEYALPEGKKETILILQNAILDMHKTFEGVPMYVNHQDGEDPTQIREIECGRVIRSFYNAADGKHWCEFLISTEEGLSAIKRGWKLSNAYTPVGKTVGGIWHGANYDYEVVKGQGDHIAIVDNPRYAESVIKTPMEFKLYNEQRESDLKKLTNSKHKSKETKSMFKLFNRKEVENSLDLENTTIVLPKSGKEMTLAQLANNMDAIENMMGYANEEHMVKCGDEEMTVKKLASSYTAMMKEKAEAEEKKNKKNSIDPNDHSEGVGMKDENKELSLNEDEEEEKKKKKENEEAGDDAAAQEKKKNELEKAKTDMEAAQKKFNDLSNAHMAPPASSAQVISIGSDMVAKGKQLF